VLVLKKYSSSQTAGRQPVLTRRNLFLRDGFECQYCGAHHSAGALTYDHVIPRSKGGKTTWENTVTACGPCNNRKGSRLLKEMSDMQLRAAPRIPNWNTLNQGSKAFPPKRMHESWIDFFY
jgi:5-methylcytosine-specific restriction endonuclease McrA